MSYLPWTVTEVCVNRANGLIMVHLILDIEILFMFCEIFLIPISPCQKSMSLDGGGWICTLILRSLYSIFYMKLT